MIRRFGTELRALLMLADVTVAVVLALLISRVLFPGRPRATSGSRRCRTGASVWPSWCPPGS